MAKLGTKLAATTNYCDFDVVAGDALTRTILSEDEEIADAVVQAYTFFVGVVDQIQEKRHARLNPGKSLSDCSQEDIDAVPDFMFALKARFHGSTAGERARIWASTLAAALNGFAASLEETKDGTGRSTKRSTISRDAARRRARNRS
jgi:hypothetical protein